MTLDIHMPQMDGLACLDRIMIEHPCPVVMVSSLTAEGAEATLQALRLGAIDFVAKPEGAISLHIDELTDELIDQGARCSHRADKVERPPQGARQAPHRPRRAGDRRKTGDREPGRRDSREPRRAAGEGLVLVGTSTGGPPALEALLTALPADFRWPIVVAQHMPATFTGALARRLNGVSALHRRRGRADAAAPAGLRLYRQGRCRPRRSTGAPRASSSCRSARKPITHGIQAPTGSSDLPWITCSPAQIVGVLMTGMGSDGAEAMALLHARGGRTIAEAEETAVVWGMPGELVKAGGADWVLPLPEIAGWLTKLVP